MAAAIASALLALPAHSEEAPPPPSSAKDGAHNCPSPILGHGYGYCGRHWQQSKLPVRFRINMAGAPASIASDFTLAADLAALTWDVASPIIGTGPRTQRTCLNAKIICVESISVTGGMSPYDGVNTIVWANLGPAAAPGFAAITWGPGDRILDVDIQLNSGRSWYFDDPPKLATGLTFGPVAAFCPNFVCPDHLDVQAILTHEFGHALGLGHVNPGNPEAYWPSDLEDAAAYNLVMYPRYYPNNATQRVLGWGDVIGLNVVMLDSFRD